MSIEFMEPPVRQKSLQIMDYDAIASELKQNRDKWAKIMTTTNATHASQIKKGVKPAFRPAGEFEAVSRSNDQGTIDIYARWVGRTVYR